MIPVQDCFFSPHACNEAQSPQALVFARRRRDFAQLELPIDGKKFAYGDLGMTLCTGGKNPGKLIGTAIFGLVLSVVGILQAVEPARDFLKALREKGYYEEAIEYLDSVQSNPGVPVEFKETLLYERGLTLVEGSRHKRDNALREKDLNNAQESLRKFVAENPEHLLAMAAQSQTGNVTMERGHMLVERAKKQADKKDELLAQAKTQFEQAIKVFADLREDLKKRLGAIPQVLNEKDKAHARLIEQRDRWRTDYLQAQLLAAAAHEELADAVKPGSKEHTDALNTAAKDFGDVYDKYRTRIAGLYARIYQARCLIKLQGVKDNKNLQDAITYLGEVLATPDSAPEIRDLKMKAYLQATEAWQKAGQHAESVLKGGAWIEDARPNEQRDPDLQQIRVNVAEAILKYAEELKAKDPASKDARAALSKGREYVNQAFKFADGAVKKKAGELIPRFGGAEKVAQEDKEPKNFEEAKNLGKEAIDSIPAAQMTLKMVPPRIKTETDTKVREELEQQVKEAQATLATAKTRALKYFRIAAQKANEETSFDDLNTVRYFLCYLEYDAGNYYDALTYGQFLAYHDSSGAGGRQGALIAMASCQKLYAEEKSEDKEFESQRILKIAQYIVDKWPEEKEAEEALNTLIPFLIKAGRLQDAEKYVQQIPESSSYRGMAELKTGQALWANYLTGMRDVRELESELQTWEEEGFPEGRTAASVAADLEKMRAPLETLKKRAQETLVDGVQRMQAAGQVNPIVASASLSLAQIYVDLNDAEKAVALLEDPKIGALTLVKKEDESASREGFAEEVYKTSLRAYISSLAGSKDADVTVGKAREMMDALKERMSATPEGEQRLVLSYVGVARDLQQQLDIASDDATRANLAKGFEAFLKQVGEQATDFNILNWVAETFRRMGDAFGRDKATNKPKKEAQDYYNQAIATYEKILDTAAKDDKFLPSANTKAAVQRQLAMTYRDVGKYVESINTFKEILSANPGLIAVQMEAAYTYQAWAGVNDKPETVKMYAAAVSGFIDKKTNKHVIWGWKPMADKIAGDSRFTQQFYEARYNLAFCRFKYGLAQKDKALRDKAIGVAKLDIELTAKLFPDLGGQQWRTKFDTLLRNIQREQGDRQPRGLAAVITEAPAPNVGSGTNN